MLQHSAWPMHAVIDANMANYAPQLGQRGHRSCCVISSSVDVSNAVTAATRPSAVLLRTA